MKYKAKSITLIEALQNKYPRIDRQKLYAHILHGDVLVAGHRERNHKRTVLENQSIEMAHNSPFASRGGQKLDSVIESAEKAGFAYKGRVLLDVGASTGGFSDCLLKYGASEIHTVDVGYNLLEYRLRTDARVHVHERCNIMSLKRGELQPDPSFAVIDLSFRSLIGAASHVMTLLYGENPQILALIKPQFELKKYLRRYYMNGNISVGKNDNSMYNNEKSNESTYEPNAFSGVIQSEMWNSQIVTQVCSDLKNEKLSVQALWKSGIRGRKGNQEFFVLLSKGENFSSINVQYNI